MIQSYSYNPAQHLGYAGRPRKKVYFGVELEYPVKLKAIRRTDSFGYSYTDYDDEGSEAFAEKVCSAVGNDFVVAKYDSSVGEYSNVPCNGMEFVSKPASLQVHYNRWKPLFDYLPQGRISSRSAGMHVHLSRDPLPDALVENIILFVANPTNKVFIDRVAGRTENEYCSRGRRDFNALLDLKKGVPVKPKMIRVYDYWENRYRMIEQTPRISSIIDSDDHHEAVTTGRSKRTIEIRIFATPKNYIELRKNLQFCHALVVWCGLKKDVDQVIDSKEFMKWLFKQGSIYKDLQGWVRKSFKK